MEKTSFKMNYSSGITESFLFCIYVVKELTFLMSLTFVAMNQTSGQFSSISGKIVLFFLACQSCCLFVPSFVIPEIPGLSHAFKNSVSGCAGAFQLHYTNLSLYFCVLQCKRIW